MIYLTHAELKPDPEQVRRSLKNIRSMADSIHADGLLQNLVVRETPNGYVIVAGERRWHAIHMLIEQERWPPDKPIPCLVNEGDGMWANIAENEKRQEVDPWDLGHRFCEIIETGRTQTEIAGRLHITQGRVSQLVQIAEGLAPETVTLLRKSHHKFPMTDLLRIAKLSKLDHFKNTVPDEEAQIKAIKHIASGRGPKRRRKRPGGVKEREKVFMRFVALRDRKTGSTPDENELIAAFVDYLSGRKNTLRLKEFRIERL